MCGINGIAFSSQARRHVNPTVLKSMRDVITHRGPDDEGIFIDEEIGLGHRRLSIVDVAFGHQPMTNEDGSLHITYNGEIYNHSDYRETLIGRGYAYRTHCDTETILHLYAEYGSNCVDYLLGMFLSGGIDSSAIAAVMSTLVDEPIKTFSVAFAEREANELEYARVVARAFKTDHHEVVISPELFFRALPELIWHEDEPLAHPSSVALYFVSRLASEHVKVVLTGEGSDELMAGYARYRKTILNLALGERYHRIIPTGFRDLVRKRLDGMTGSRLRLKLGRTFLNLPPDIESIYFDNFAVFSRSDQAQLLTHETVERIGGIDPYAGVRESLKHTDAQSLLDRLL